jgi:hypothetical protein
MTDAKAAGGSARLTRTRRGPGAMEGDMKTAFYCPAGDTVRVFALNVTLMFEGAPWSEEQEWSGSTDAFEKLKAENPDVEWINDCPKFKGQTGAL